MRKAGILLVLAAGLLSPSAGKAQASAVSPRLREVLPAEGLIASSVVRVRDQAALDAHYYLADESVLGLDAKAEAILARYRAGGREALILVVAYPTEARAAEVYGRFGRDFFPGGFDPRSARVIEELESGDSAGAVRVRAVLIVVLEAPDRKICETLLRRAEERALARF